MTDAQIEAAARKLCELRGVDPNVSVAHDADPDPVSGVTMDILLHSPAWMRAAREICRADFMRQALAVGDAVKEGE